MPLYVGKCKQCGQSVEVLAKYEDRDEETCVCGGKLLWHYAPFGLKFVGHGFYVNDYKAKDKS